MYVWYKKVISRKKASRTSSIEVLKNTNYCISDIKIFTTFLVSFESGRKISSAERVVAVMQVVYIHVESQVVVVTGILVESQVAVVIGCILVESS